MAERHADMKPKILHEFTMGATHLFLIKSAYAIDNSDAYVIQMNHGVPYATLSVNIADADLLPGEVAIKTWSENEPIAARMLELGYFKDTGKRIPTGFVEAQVWTYMEEEA